MKKRIIITVLATSFYGASVYLLNLVKSPLIGTLNSSQMTDKVSDYIVWKAVSDGIIETAIMWIFILTLCVAWGSLFFRKQKN